MAQSINIKGFALLLEFLENPWNFENFFQGPRKLLEIFINSTVCVILKKEYF
jgi:hypothetical protein